MAAYGARACLTGHLFTLERASPAKLAQIRAHGPQIYAVRGLGLTPEAERATWSNLAELCNRRDWGMLVTAYRFSPHAMEGVKTIAFELFEQLGGVPAAVYVPVGGGGLLWGLWRGFLELQAAGLKLERQPCQGRGGSGMLRINVQSHRTCLDCLGGGQRLLTSADLLRRAGLRAVVSSSAAG